MERSSRPSLAANGGQLFAVRADAYARAGGHKAVRTEILEDIELSRQVKRTGGRIALADGSRLASCRMYDSWHGLVEGYSKSLWASFGSPVASVLAIASSSSRIIASRVTSSVVDEVPRPVLARWFGMGNSLPRLRERSVDQWLVD